jgi:hypothetical protein
MSRRAAAQQPADPTDAAAATLVADRVDLDLYVRGARPGALVILDIHFSHVTADEGFAALGSCWRSAGKKHGENGERLHLTEARTEPISR